MIHFSNFGQVKNMSHFANFGQVKIMNHFADFEQVNNVNKTSLGETGCLCNPYFLLTGCLGIQSFDSPPIPTVRLLLVTYLSLCSTSVTYRTPCHSIGHSVLPTQPLPREAQDFPRCDKYFKHVPPLTYLIYFSPKEVYTW